MKTTEIDKLEKYLKDIGYEYERVNMSDFDGEQIIVMSEGKRIWDAVCHSYSYGGKEGLLEIYGTIVDKESVGDDVEGWLTAEDVIFRIIKIYGLLRHEGETSDSSVGELFEAHMSLNLAYWRAIIKSWSKEWPV